MRGHQLRALIISTIEAITPDFQATSRDRFRYDPDQSDTEQRPHRSFVLVQGQLSPSTSFTTHQKTAAFRLVVYYEDSPNAGDITLADGERIQTALWAVNGTLHPDISGISQMGDWIPNQSSTPNMLEATIDFAVSYSLTFS